MTTVRVRLKNWPSWKALLLTTRKARRTLYKRQRNRNSDAPANSTLTECRNAQYEYNMCSHLDARFVLVEPLYKQELQLPKGLRT